MPQPGYPGCGICFTVRASHPLVLFLNRSAPPLPAAMPAPPSVRHPAVRLLLCLLLALAAQALPALLAAALVLPLLRADGVAGRCRTLLRRTRWLLLSLFLVFALGTPGTPLYDHAWSPSREGVFLGLEQCLRLATVLLAVSWLLHRTRPAALAQGLLTLLQPLRYLGLAPERGIARLLLVMRHVDSAEAWPRGQDWRRFLEMPAQEQESVLEVELHPLPGPDRLLLAGMGLGILVLLASPLWLP